MKLEVVLDRSFSKDVYKRQGSIPGLRISSGVGNGNPLQYSCLENSMDRGAWWATVQRITEELDMTEQLNKYHLGVLLGEP